jgi:hypothetical protein
MIVHRAYRDIQRCKVKYGESWTEYEKLVPYLFIPVSLSLHFSKTRLISPKVCLLRPQKLFRFLDIPQSSGRIEHSGLLDNRVKLNSGIEL